MTAPIAHAAAKTGNAPSDRASPGGGAWVEKDMNARKQATGVEYTRRDVDDDISVDQALAIKNTEIVAELSLPPVKIHCSVLAEDAIKAAIADYKKKQAEAGGEKSAHQPAQPTA